LYIISHNAKIEFIQRAQEDWCTIRHNCIANNKSKQSPWQVNRLVIKPLFAVNKNWSNSTQTQTSSYAIQSSVTLAKTNLLSGIKRFSINWFEKND
jgi:hypothetical protein